MKSFIKVLLPACIFISLSCAKKADETTGPDISDNFSLSVTILESGAGVPGVALLLSGSANDFRVTGVSASAGEYSFSNLPDGAYTLTPSKADYLFTPPEITIIANDRQAHSIDFVAEKLGISFVSITAGAFQMGDETGDLKSDCLPVHTVTISGFEMSVFEITNAQYARFLNKAMKTGGIIPSSSSVKGVSGAFNGQEYLYLAGAEPSYPDARCWIAWSDTLFSVEPGRESWPVTWVTWYGAKAFALYYGLDLPTEAEWEYACRGGKQFKYGTDDGLLRTSQANYWNSGINHPVAVGSYSMNPFGLADMSGNVWEWCHDWYGPYPSESVNNPTGAQTGQFRVIRGGGWSFDASGCRAAFRYTPKPAYRYYSLGFRVVRRAVSQNY